MSALWTIFLARLFDPIGALIALTIGSFGKSKWIILIGGLVAAAITDWLLIRMERVDGFAIGPFLAGLAAFSLWSALGHLAFRRMMGKVSK
ncbi:hypothetical protein [Maritimibacter fusiformis]|jgi:hypothetical protein|uniref:Uncharacterized protein n=1 Tax=Maritimibacter fusiformis TaxID=2603819 RepID=A0A5D0RQZ8_9RHOB|nr:hypothetical protein [Maritimibacter fusiformis]TYB83539.1 hypothetical protein FVF75_00485 [Maritimibacter fusiformis]